MLLVRRDIFFVTVGIKNFKAVNFLQGIEKNLGFFLRFQLWLDFLLAKNLGKL